MISLSFTLGDGNRNLLLIAVMGISPLLLILTPIITRTDIKIYAIIILTILCPLLNHPSTVNKSIFCKQMKEGITLKAAL
jgi:hypothetical protein